MFDMHLLYCNFKLTRYTVKEGDSLKSGDLHLEKVSGKPDLELALCENSQPCAYSEYSGHVGLTAKST